MIICSLCRQTLASMDSGIPLLQDIVFLWGVLVLAPIRVHLLWIIIQDLNQLFNLPFCCQLLFVFIFGFSYLLHTRLAGSVDHHQIPFRSVSMHPVSSVGFEPTIFRFAVKKTILNNRAYQLRQLL